MTSQATDRSRTADRHDTIDHDATLEAFRRMRAEPDPQRRHLLADELVERHLPAARSMAMRYRDRGIPLDDLVQVASLGLVKAVHGYDCELGTDFMAYATPTIRGELKRHFRDAGWAVRPTRKLQELRPRIARVVEESSQRLGRAPTVNELAEELSVPAEDVIEAMASGSGYATLSLDAPPDGEHGSWADLVPGADLDMSGTPDRLALQQALKSMPPRDRRILAMRFFADMTQTEIGREIGVTQMQVSRLLSRSLARLREQLDEDEPSVPDGPPVGVRSAVPRR